MLPNTQYCSKLISVSPPAHLKLGSTQNLPSESDHIAGLIHDDRFRALLQRSAAHLLVTLAISRMGGYPFINSFKLHCIARTYRMFDSKSHQMLYKTFYPFLPGHLLWSSISLEIAQCWACAHQQSRHSEHAPQYCRRHRLP